MAFPLLFFRSSTIEAHERDILDSWNIKPYKKFDIKDAIVTPGAPVRIKVGTFRLRGPAFFPFALRCLASDPLGDWKVSELFSRRGMFYIPHSSRPVTMSFSIPHEFTAGDETSDWGLDIRFEDEVWRKRKDLDTVFSSCPWIEWEWEDKKSVKPYKIAIEMPPPSTSPRQPRIAPKIRYLLEVKEGRTSAMTLNRPFSSSPALMVAEFNFTNGYGEIPLIYEPRANRPLEFKRDPIERQQHHVVFRNIKTGTDGLLLHVSLPCAKYLDKPLEIEYSYTKPSKFDPQKHLLGTIRGKARLCLKQHIYANLAGSKKPVGEPRTSFYIEYPWAFVSTVDIAPLSRSSLLTPISLGRQGGLVPNFAVRNKPNVLEEDAFQGVLLNECKMTFQYDLAFYTPSPASSMECLIAKGEEVFDLAILPPYSFVRNCATSRAPSSSSIFQNLGIGIQRTVHPTQAVDAGLSNSNLQATSLAEEPPWYDNLSIRSTPPDYDNLSVRSMRTLPRYDG